MKSVGTYRDDSTEHVMIPLSQNTLCGLIIEMASSIDSNGYYKEALPKPAEYAAPCKPCRERVFRLEDLLNDLCSGQEG